MDHDDDDDAKERMLVLSLPHRHCFEQTEASNLTRKHRDRSGLKTEEGVKSKLVVVQRRGNILSSYPENMHVRDKGKNVIKILDTNNSCHNSVTPTL